ncbi:MAG: restriction endonuclease subunit S [Crocinitomicaceae bacterium]|nr:restriction endonuclease subunit S [Crocinitomicaceae bacterium]
MKSKIQDIATLQTGLFAKPLAKGEVVYLQSKHFDDQGNLLTTLHPDLLKENISEKHFLRAGDILFAAKGTKNFAAVYEEHNPPAVASTSFFVIRLFDSKINPEYLTWFLNNSNTQAILKSQAIGTSIPSISKQVLENFEISIPIIEMQNAILQITKLRNKEKYLKQKIETIREKQIQQQILNAIK